MNKTFNKTVCSVLVSSLGLSHAAVFAQSAGAGAPPQTQVQINWTELRDIEQHGGRGTVTKLLGNDLNKLTGRESEIAINKQSKFSSSATSLNPSPPVLIVATYDQYGAKLRLDALRLEKVAGKTKIYTARLDPSFGNYWKNAGTYADPNNRSDSINPFEQFLDGGAGGTNNGMFNNISMAASGVVASHAAMLLKAPLVTLGVPIYRGNYYMTKSGPWWLNKYTHHYESYGGMKWYFGQATSLAPSGAEAKICGVKLADGERCKAYQVVPSFVRFTEMQEGNIPSAEVLLRHDTDSVRDWSVVIQIIALVAIAMMPMYFPVEATGAEAFYYAGDASFATVAPVYAAPAGAGATYGAAAGCATFCTIAAHEYNDSRLDSHYDDGDRARRAQRADLESTIGIRTPVQTNEGLSYKQVYTPGFPSDRQPSDPGDSPLYQFGYAEIARRTSADPFRGTPMPQMATIINMLMPEAFIERKLVLDNTNVSNTGRSQNEYTTSGGQTNGTSTTAPSPRQKSGRSGSRDNMAN